MPTYAKTYLVDWLENALVAAHRAVRGTDPASPVEIRSNDRPQFGDYASNLALLEAKHAGLPPRDLATQLAGALRAQRSKDDVLKVEVAGPGFINLFLSPALLQQMLGRILTDGTDYGRWVADPPQRTQVEFVSSNPTGPLTVGHGRQAVLGDVLATLHGWLGHGVTREYYFNDEGRQIELLTDSTAERLLETAFDIEPQIPEDGYAGDYLRTIAEQILAEVSDVSAAVETLRTLPLARRTRAELYRVLDPAIVRHEATERIIRTIKDDLAQLGVRFDTWFSEASLHRAGKIDAALDALRERDGVYDQDGAVWLRAELHGGAKDSVLIRSDGRPTYLMVDIAYHIDKRARGFQRVIDVQGADHHAEQTCVRAALRILGYPEAFLGYASHQFVSLKEGGAVLKMSTRAGRFITLRQLVDELGKDVVRYFMISRKPEAHLDFDLDLARAESLDNPATYIQYAHTRMASIFRKAATDESELSHVDLSRLVEAEELELIKELDRFPAVLRVAAEAFAPHLVADYALGLARTFHAYYDKHRVLSDDPTLRRARLALLAALRKVVGNALHILGMAAPEAM